MVKTLDLKAEGPCGAAFIGTGPLHVVTGGHDGRICIRQWDSLEAPTEDVRRLDRHPIHCVAGHPHRDQYAVGDKSGGVHVSIMTMTPTLSRKKADHT